MMRIMKKKVYKKILHQIYQEDLDKLRTFSLMILRVAESLPYLSINFYFISKTVASF